MQEHNYKPIEIYLITGFLGAGKTTFLKNFVRLHASKKQRIIVNEFGKEGIDGELLRELPVLIDEINNGSIFCSCRLEQFENVLKKAIADAPEMIIIEASGLSDPTNIHKILNGANDKSYENATLAGCICLVDAVNFKKVISTAQICKKQLSVSDLVIINKADIASNEDIELTEKLIFDLYPMMKTHLTSFGEIKAEWLEEISCKKEHTSKLIQTKDLGLQKALLRLNDSIDMFHLNKLLSMLVEESYRIKGFVIINAVCYLVSCVGGMISITEHPVPQGENVDTNALVVLAGAGMAMEKSIKTATEWYGEHIVSVE